LRPFLLDADVVLTGTANRKGQEIRVAIKYVGEEEKTRVLEHLSRL
jgi:TolB-like protein